MKKLLKHCQTVNCHFDNKKNFFYVPKMQKCRPNRPNRPNILI